MSHAPARVALRTGSFVLGIAIVASTFSGPARAQEVLQKAYGSSGLEYFGTSVAMGPDLDGDGFREVAVGAPDLDSMWPETGAVYILSGRDFSRMQTLTGGTKLNSRFGISLCWCGDLDGDGLSELAVGVPGESSVQIFSSSTWTLLRTLTGASTDIEFGDALADAGDLNGDGIDDLIVGAPYRTPFLYAYYYTGAMYVYSGSDGSLLWSVDGAPGSDLGWSVAVVGDINGDGYVDFAVGEPAFLTSRSGVAGTVVVYSGKDQSVLQQWFGNSQSYYSSWYGTFWYGDELGIAVGAAGDFDGDGVPDVWAASRWGVPKAKPYVKVFSGATGATLQTFVCASGDYQTGAAAIGDLNGDGRSEFISICQYPRSGVFIFSSIDGKVLWQIDDWSSKNEFTAVAADPFSSADFLVGSGFDDTAGPDAGRVELRATNDLWLDVSPSHDLPANTLLTLRASEGPPGNLAALFLTSVNGAPFFTFLSLGSFDATGSAFLLTARVPFGARATPSRCAPTRSAPRASWSTRATS